MIVATRELEDDTHEDYKFLSNEEKDIYNTYHHFRKKKLIF